MSSSSRSSRRSSADELSSMIASLRHLDLSGHILSDSPVLTAHGGYCDVFIGRWMKQGVCIYKVAIKRLRVYVQRDRDFARLLVKEIRVWSKLAHRNILPLLGFIIEGEYPSLISEWMENGTAKRYVEAHPEWDIFKLIIGIAEGLKYLHDEGVIHSDIKADNILISNDGAPRICDFGISRMLAASQTLNSSTTGHTRGSVRWMAIELLNIDDQTPAHTIETDIWAFGMTVHEMLARELPYANLRFDVQVMFAIISGAQPKQPASFNSWPLHHQKVWNMCQVCWRPDPAQRYNMHYVVSYLKFLSRFDAGEFDQDKDVDENIKEPGTSSITDQMRTRLQIIANEFESTYTANHQSNYVKRNTRSGHPSRGEAITLDHHGFLNDDVPKLSSSYVSAEQCSQVRTNSSPTVVAVTEYVGEEHHSTHVSNQASPQAFTSSQGPVRCVAVPMSRSEISEGSRDCLEKVQTWMQDLDSDVQEPEVPSCPSPCPSFESTAAVWLSASDSGSNTLIEDQANKQSASVPSSLPLGELNICQVEASFDNDRIDSWRNNVSDDTQRDDAIATIQSSDNMVSTELKAEQCVTELPAPVQQPPAPGQSRRSRRTLRRITGTVSRATAADED